MTVYSRYRSFHRCFSYFFISIARVCFYVECFLHVCCGRQLFQQNGLRPLLNSCLLQIPFTSLSCQFRFHDDHIQRPADFHCQPEECLVIFISLVKIAKHPARVAR